MFSKVIFFIIFVVLFSNCTGIKVSEVYFQPQTNSNWKQSFMLEAKPQKEYSYINTRILVVHSDVFTYNYKMQRIDTNYSVLPVMIMYQTNEKNICDISDINIKIADIIYTPYEIEKTFKYGTKPPVLGCVYLFDLNPYAIKKFHVLFNKKVLSREIPSIELIRNEREATYGISP